MRARDDLIAAFARGIPARVAHATELWLGFEQGQAENLHPLRRLLHTVKGEGHMLELPIVSELAELAESVVGAAERAQETTPLTGDALLGAFDAVGLLVSLEPGERMPDLESLKDQLGAAVAELDRRPPGEMPAPKAASAPPRAARLSGRPDARSLSAEETRPLVHEMKRLYGEQAILQKRLQEAQRTLRDLLAELSRESTMSEGLALCMARTLGYRSDLDRQLSGIRADWSSNDFAMGLALDELESIVRKASVVSADRLLNQVRRVARSTARTLGKDVDLSVKGDAILDAAVERRLEPALLHLVHNAIDHGIESAELRKSRGKPARGKVQVSVSQTESSVIVEVADDGGGVDFDRLRRVLSGRVANLENLRNEELLPHLFEQGVTTSDRVTTISGRGVGLDVVAREVAAAGGQIRIESSREAGTRLVLDVPTTLRGELAVPVLSGQRRYAVPSRAILAVTRLEKIEHSQGSAWVRVPTDSGPQLVRLFSLSALLGDGDPPQIGQAILVLYHASGLYALTVEGCDNPRPLTVQLAEELRLGSPLVRGVAPTPDGGVMLLLDVEAVYAVARAKGAMAHALVAGPPLS